MPFGRPAALRPSGSTFERRLVGVAGQLDRYSRADGTGRLAHLRRPRSADRLRAQARGSEGGRGASQRRPKNMRPRTRVALLGAGLLASKRYRRRWLQRLLILVVVVAAVLLVVRATGLTL